MHEESSPAERNVVEGRERYFYSTEKLVLRHVGRGERAPRVPLACVTCPYGEVRGEEVTGKRGEAGTAGKYTSSSRGRS